MDAFVSDAQTQGASTTCSSISDVRFGIEGVIGLQNVGLRVDELADTEAKDTVAIGAGRSYVVAELRWTDTDVVA